VQTIAGRARLGAATSMVSLARSVGAAIGAALFGALAFSMIPEVPGHSLLASDGAGNSALLHAFHRAFLFAAGVAALAALAASRIPAVRLWQAR
jgi:hypothetical protein